MKISAFNPLILTKDAASAVALFEALGFERQHMKTGIDDKDITSVTMKDPNGLRMDVTQVGQIPQDLTTIRISVDNFEEAVEFFSARGFKDAQGGRVTDTGTSKATMMVSPSGFAVSLSQHIKK